MKRFLCVATVILVLGVSLTAEAVVTTVPQSALTASNYYYTDLIGGWEPRQS